MNTITRLLRYDWPLHFVLTITNWLPDNVPFLRLRGALARPFFGRCGPNLRLGRNITFYNPSKINLGRDVYIAYGCWFMGIEEINIGNEVLFGPYSVVVTSNHSRLNGSYRFGIPKSAPIKIGEGCWLGAHVTLTAGCCVGNGSLIAANSVLTKDIPCNVLAGGVPAKVIKVLSE